MKMINVALPKGRLGEKVYDMFEKEYGIRVVYDEYAAPEDMYAKFTSGSAKYDLICTSDYMIEKLIKEEFAFVLKIDEDSVIPYILDKVNRI